MQVACGGATMRDSAQLTMRSSARLKRGASTRQHARVTLPAGVAPQCYVRERCLF